MLKSPFEPCIPTRGTKVPDGAEWLHEIKHDGYRVIVRRDGGRVRCFTRNGHDWADRFRAIVDAALRLKASSFLLDGEVVIARDDGTPDFHALRGRRRSHEATDRAQAAARQTARQGQAVFHPVH